MTPLEPNGQNGGAGLVAATLVHHLGTLAPDLFITLLTAQASHAELAALDAPNVRRQCVVASRTSRSRARKLADRLLPPRTVARLASAYWSVTTSRRYGRVTDDLRPNLLLCPFTVPYFWRPGVPCVSIVYDLQEVTYPEFFTAAQRLNRRRHVEDACARSDRVVCISDYVRGTLLNSVGVRPERVVTIPLGLLHASPEPDRAVIKRLALTAGEFLLYPANFWPHKNHRNLFAAMQFYCQSHPDSRLKLVCTGAPNARMRELELEAASLLPSGAVVFAGYVGPAELEALVGASRGLICPSLYEGFGMPVLEGMAHAKPVLCSNVTSLPEVAGGAAVYFDPNDPGQIAAAIEALDDAPRVAGLVARGLERAAALGTGRDMAARYLALLRQVMAAGAA